MGYLPAHPWTIAAYFRWCELRKPFHAIEEAGKAIARAHLLQRRGRPHRHRTVKRTLRMIELRAGHRDLYGDLFPEADFSADKKQGADFSADKNRGADFSADENRGADFSADKNRGADFSADENRGADFSADKNNSAAPENRQPARRRVQSMRSRPPLVSRRR